MRLRDGEQVSSLAPVVEASDDAPGDLAVAGGVESLNGSGAAESEEAEQPELDA
jgi:hypothetical protein